MIVRPYEKGDEEYMSQPREKHICIDSSWAWTVEDGNRVVAIVGCSDFYPTVGHLWAIVSDDVKNKGVLFTRSMAKLLDSTFKYKKYNRIQAFCDSKSDANKKWLEVLGLKYESTMVKASPDGGNFDVYARTT